MDLDASFLSFSDLYASMGVSGSGLHLTSGGEMLTKLDGLVVRDLGRGRAHNVAFRFEVLRALEDLEIPVVNSSEAIARAANKFATSVALHHAGVNATKPYPNLSLDTKAWESSCWGKMMRLLFGP
jgi:hypothetical protein